MGKRTAKLTLKEARKQDKLKEIIKEHRGEKGDIDAFNDAIASMTGTQLKARKASTQAGSGHCADTQTPRRKKKDA